MPSKNMYLSQIKTLSINNKYLKWYINIVLSGLHRSKTKKESQSIIGYTESHHILPRCMCDESQKSDVENIVHLTAREHFLVHWLLCKLFTGKNKISMWCAMASFLQNNNDKNKDSKINSHQYQILKKYSSKQASVRFTGIPKTKEHNKKNSESHKDKKRNPFSNEWKNNMSKAKLGKPSNNSSPSKRCSCVICRKCIGINNLTRHYTFSHL